MSEIDPGLLADLLREAMREGKSPFVTVVSNSMSPLIRRGDKVRLAHVNPDQMLPGDIIVYEGPANLITHRYWGFLTEKGQTRLVTRGDRPQYFDEPFSAANLVGQVIGRRRKNHFLNFEGGTGKWLNNHLANLARLEIRLFSKPLLSSNRAQVNLPAAGRRLSRSPNNLIVRLIRRFLYSWAIILTLVISVVTNSTDMNYEDS